MSTDREIEVADETIMDQIIELSNQAENHANKQEFNKAIQPRQQTIQLSEQYFGLDHERTLMYKTILAFYYRNQGRWSDAENLDRDVLARRRKVLGKEHDETAKSLSNLALDLNGQGRYDESMEFLRQSADLLVRTKGKDNRASVTSLHNLANSYAQAGRYEDAASIHESTLQSRIRMFGKTNVETIIAIDTLAIDYVGLGELARARQLQEEAVELAKTHLGPTHDSTVKCISNLGSTYRKSGDAPTNWIESLETAVRECRKPGQDYTPATIGIINTLALAYGEEGRAKDAKPLFVECYDWSMTTLGRNHPHTDVARQNLEWVLEETGELAWAPAIIVDATGVS